MGVGLPPLEFTECMSDSPKFRDNLHKHEKELENTSQQIKRLSKEVKDLLNASKQLSNSQRSFAKSLQSFSFDCIGGTQTDDERVICKSLEEFGKLISSIEDERDRMLENAYNQVVNPLETFRKSHIGAVKAGKKKFDKQTAKFCQCQERYLNLTTKKQNDSALKEADASVGMAERHFYNASMEYVFLIQEVHERKKFEFVETLLGFMIGWLTFYHNGYEVAKDFNPYKKELQLSLQKTRGNFEDYRLKLRRRMAEIQKQVDPVRNTKGRKEGYLFLLEKKAFGNTWTKHFCTYDKENKEFSMIPYNQIATKSVPQPEVMVLSSCIRRMSDSIDKRFCFDLQVDSRPGLIHTFQALNDTDRKAWMDIMDGKEPTYINPNPSVKIQNAEERILDDNGIQFVKKCIEVLESRSLEEQGLYRVVGVTSKVSKLLSMGLDRRKTDKPINLDDPLEWETKTITSALKSYLRNLPEPLMTHRFHNGFIAAVKNDSRPQRIHDVHTLTYRIPKLNFEVLKILIKHLSNVAERCDKNLMTVSNLGVCFGPTLLRPEEETVASIVDLKFYNIVVEILIGNYEKIFNSEPEMIQIFANNMLPQQQTGNFSNNGGHLSPIDQSSPINYADADYGNNLKMYSPNHNASNSRIAYNNQPIMCTVRSTYYDPNSVTTNNMSSSLYNVHESPPNNGVNFYSNMSKSEHVPNNGAPAMPHHKLIPRINSTTISSQSESNIPSLHSYSPTNFRSYGRLENSTSSSNESVSSNSRDGGTSSYLNNLQLPPEKSNRSNLGVSYPKGYKSQGAMTLRKDTHSPSVIASGRSSPSVSGLRRVRTLYACLGENDGELSFEPNQIITNVKSSQEPGWLEGTLNGKTGLIPENYVEMLP